MKKIFSYFKNIKLAKVALFFSIFAACVYAIKIYKRINEVAEFGFYSQMHLDFIQKMTKPPKGFSDQIRSILLVGAIYNDGTLPLFPGRFTLTAKYKDERKIDFEAISFVDTTLKNAGPKGGFQVNFTNKADIKDVVKINPHDATYGYLQFFVPNQNRYRFNDIEYLIINCYDIMGKKRSKKIETGDPAERNMDYNSNKSGVDVKPS